MTLIMDTIFTEGDINPESFIIVTADTRMVFKPFFLETSELGEGTLEIRNDIYDKVIRLTDNVLLSTGGIQTVYEAFRDFMIKNVNKNYFLDDLEPILRDAYNFLKKSHNPLIKRYIDSNYVHVRLTGFFKDGLPGELKLGSDGEIFNSKVPHGNFASGMFSPTQDILDNKEVLLDFTKSPFSPTKDIFDLVINHLIYIHAIIASQEVETVSETCLVHVLQKINGEIHYGCTEHILTEQVKKIQETAVIKT